MKHVKNPHALWFVLFALPLGTIVGFFVLLFAGTLWDILLWDVHAFEPIWAVIVRPVCMIFAAIIAVCAIFIAFFAED